MPKMTIERGASGSGKSTHAKSLGTKSYDPFAGVQIISADDFFMRRGVYNFDPSLLGEAHSSCIRKAVAGIMRRADLVIDNTNCRVSEIAPYYALGEAYGYEVEIICHTPDFLDQPNTLQSFAKRSSHGVPLATIQNMQYLIDTELLPPWWKQTIIYVNGA